MRKVGDSIWLTNIYIQLPRIISDFPCTFLAGVYFSIGQVMKLPVLLRIVRNIWQFEIYLYA